MSSILTFFDQLLEERLAHLHTSFLGRIERFDAQKMLVDVQPLLQRKYTNGTVHSLPLLINLPVLLMKAGAFFIRPPYKKGDLVLVVCTERSIDEVAGASTSNPSRKHSLEDSLVVGGVQLFAGQLPEEHSEDLLIAKADMSTKLVLDTDGRVTIQTEASDLNLSTVDGNINISSVNGRVNISGKQRADSW